jgi:hypothetical protein
MVGSASRDLAPQSAPFLKASLKPSHSFKLKLYRSDPPVAANHRQSSGEFCRLKC